MCSQYGIILFVRVFFIFCSVARFTSHFRQRPTCAVLDSPPVSDYSNLPSVQPIEDILRNHRPNVLRLSVSKMTTAAPLMFAELLNRVALADVQVLLLEFAIG